MRRRRIAACLLILAGGAVILDRLLPPDLTRFQNLSNVVLATDGTVLNVATTKDGMWRLATRPDAVDRHYLDMLLAAEDHRFRSHPGVDPWAVARAANCHAARATAQGSTPGWARKRWSSAASSMSR